MNPPPTPEQRRLFSELVLSGQQGKRIKRIDVRRLFRDSRFTTLRRYIMACSLVATQAMEGIDVSFTSAYSLQR
jgi:hypothetical protein